MVISSNDYINIISEHFDLSDYNTRKNVIGCNEDAKEAIILHLTNKLYNDIKNNVDQIDFGTIPVSKGDITKIDGFENLVSCVDTITKLVKEYNQPTSLIDTISTAINNIQKRTRLWEKSFAMNIEIPMIIYNTMTLSCVSSVSLLIKTCIEYIKNGDSSIVSSFDKAAYMKSKNHVLFKSLVDFNAGCSNGQIDRLIDNNIKNNVVKIRESVESGEGLPLPLLNEFNTSNVIDIAKTTYGLLDKGAQQKALVVGGIIGAVLIGVNIKWVIQHIFYMIRRTVYYLMFMRESAADYFTTQADFLQINAENLKYRENFQNDEDHLKEVYDKQMKWVDTFRKAANLFMIKDKKAQKETDNKENEDNKPSKYDDTSILF